MASTTNSQLNDFYERHRQAQLESAEDSAHINDRERVISALQNAGRLDVRARIREDAKAPRNEEADALSGQLAEIVYLIHCQEPWEPRFDIAWLHRVHTELWPQPARTGRQIGESANFLIKAGALRMVKPANRAWPHFLTVGEVHTLLEIIEGCPNPPGSEELTLMPAAMRSALLRNAEVLAAQGRTDEAVAFVTAAGALRDFDQASARMAELLLDNYRHPETRPIAVTSVQVSQRKPVEWEPSGILGRNARRFTRQLLPAPEPENLAESSGAAPPPDPDRAAEPPE